MPKISLITLTYNAEKYIEQTLQSVAAQTCKDFEYVILDGGSTDATLHIVERYKSIVTKVISRKDNGALDAFNKAWDDMHGDYIMLLSADDWLEPDAIATIVDGIAKNPNAKVIGFGLTNWKESSTGLVFENRLVDPEDGVFTISKAVYGSCSNHAIHRDLYVRYGLYNHATWGCFSDRELQLRFSLSNPSEAVIPRTLYHFRKHGGSTTGSGSSEVTVEYLYKSLLMATEYLDKPNLTSFQIEQLLEWYGFCWVRTVFFLLKTKQYHHTIKVVLGGLAKHPWTCLYKALFPSMPDTFKPIRTNTKAN